LRQFAQPLISEARSFSNSERVRSKLAAASSSIDVRCQTVISEGAAAKRSIFVVMIGFLLLLPISWRAGISRCDVRAEILIFTSVVPARLSWKYLEGGAAW
jgi:hypothetical protein